MTLERLASSVLVCMLAACGFEPSAGDMRFALSKRTLELTSGATDARARLASELEERFGSPREPRYALLREWIDAGLDPNHPERPRGKGGTGEVEVGDRYPSLVESAELYRQQCLHCHGVEGGGDGPTSHFLEPRPRDLRLGIFKWTALSDLARPRRHDILRTLVDGLDGTSMPSFRRFSDAELEGLVDYVRFLAIRGEVEKRLADTIADEGDYADAAPDEELAFVWGKWMEAPSKVIAFDGAVPASTHELVTRGKLLFRDATKGNCSSCHGDEGHGDGPAVWKLDARGKRTPAYIDAWGDPIVPRDLTRGHFRGGSRPIDLYRRIWTGIPGTPMPALGTALDKDGARLVPDADIWALVHYVRSLTGGSDA